MRIVPGILCGGSGTRLWPVSRTHAPKQLQALTSEKSLLAETALRLVSHDLSEPPLIICGETYAEEIADQMATEGVTLSGIVTEPMGRDTAAAAAAASQWAIDYSQSINEPVVLMLMPSDHYIAKLDQLYAAMSETAKAAMTDLIATIGIFPTSPHTGYGYIKHDTDKIDGLSSFMIDEFVEKPPIETAEEFLKRGSYVWNSGMFSFRPEVFLSELSTFEPEIAERFQTAYRDGVSSFTKNGTPVFSFRAETFSAIPKKSIDYAVMEKTKRACVCVANLGWSDVGSWAAIHEIWPKDENGNAIQGDPLLQDTHNSVIHSATGRKLAVLGMQNIAVIDTPDATLIAPINRSQYVKGLHQQLSDQDHPSADSHSSHTDLSLAKAKTWATEWLSKTAYPFWSTTGLDTKHGGSVEALSLDGAPLLDLPKRTLVQARQTFAFAQGALLGFPGCEDAMLSPLNFMLQNAALGKGRFAHKMAPDGQIVDDTVDTYDLAFILFALAYAYKVSSEPRLKESADEIITLLETDLVHPAGGFVEAKPNPARPRRANPHMHLLEAFLAWEVLHGSERAARYADQIISLYNQHFCIDGLLREHFDPDLSLVSKPSKPNFLWVEPGHLCEWSYLLTHYANLRGLPPSQTCATMNAFVETYGKQAKTGLLADGVELTGQLPPNATSRLWPQTEYIRWKMTLGDVLNQQHALRMLDAMKPIYLQFDETETGYWQDRCDRHGRIVSETSPTSSFYHIVTGLFDILTVDQSA